MQDCALQDVPARSSDCAAAVFAAAPSGEVPFKGSAKFVCFLKDIREVFLMSAIVVLLDVFLVSYPHPADNTVTLKPFLHARAGQVLVP